MARGCSGRLTITSVRRKRETVKGGQMSFAEKYDVGVVYSTTKVASSDSAKVYTPLAFQAMIRRDLAIEMKKEEECRETGRIDRCFYSASMNLMQPL